MEEGRLQDRLARIEGQEAIAALKARYAELCDQGYPPDALAALFTEDAVWEGGLHRVRLVGRSAIRDYFAGVAGRIPFARHLVMNAQIEIAGDRAWGRWGMLMPHALRDEGGATAARWQVSTYREEYLRVAGAWRFAHLSAAPVPLDPATGLWREGGAQP